MEMKEIWSVVDRWYEERVKEKTNIKNSNPLPPKFFMEFYSTLYSLERIIGDTNFTKSVTEEYVKPLLEKTCKLKGFCERIEKNLKKGEEILYDYKKINNIFNKTFGGGENFAKTLISYYEKFIALCDVLKSREEFKKFLKEEGIEIEKYINETFQSTQRLKKKLPFYLKKILD